MSTRGGQLGRYELLHCIAAGGMGEIYLAQTEGAAGFEKTVIIKKILPHLAEQEEFVERFLDEGRIVVELTHSNIVPVFDMDEVDGEYFIAMQYVPGRDLRDLMKRVREDGGQMPVDLALHITSEVCEGLGYAHRQTDQTGQPLNIVHRDVSPSNVLISTEGEVKIIDFGIARAAGRRARTLSGQIEGKCRYMSPEQATGKDIDHRSDIFSTGVVFYEMLTGVSPFEGESDLESLELVRQCKFDPPSDLNARVDEEIDAIVGRALAREREERYQSIEDLQDELVDQLYERGRAVTNRDLADFLEEKFPEGPEREEFRESSDVPAADDDLGLQEALEFEADRLDERSVRSATAAREPTPTDPAPRAADATAAGDGAEADDERAPETPEPAQQRRAPVDRSPTLDRDWRRWGVLAAGAVLIAAATVAGLVSGGGSGAESARLRVASEPDGASIAVDGEEIEGERTPAVLRVEPGVRRVRVDPPGREAKRFRVELDSGERDRLDAEYPDPPEGPSGARTFTIRTHPERASLSVNQQPVGTAPTDIRVSPGETKLVRAEMSGCDAARMPVFHGRSSDEVEIRLACPDTGPVAAAAGEPRDAAAGEDDGERRVRFVSDPPGATLFVGDRRIGTTPHTATYDVDRRLDVRLEDDEHRPVDFEVAVREVTDGVVRRELEARPRGCLNFFAVRPQFNRIAIDGVWLDGRRQKLEDYPLPVGEHRLRVQNPEAGRDETFDFRIRDREKCTSLTVWDPTED